MRCLRALIGSGVLALAVTGCGGSQEPAAAPGEEAAPPPTAAEPTTPPPAEPAAPATSETPAEAKPVEPATDPNAPREVRYIQSPEGLKVEASGVRFAITATPAKTPAGFGVKVAVKAESIDNKPHTLLGTDNGPLAIAGAVTRKGKTVSFGDERKGEAEQTIAPGAPLEFAREWPGKGPEKPLSNGDSAELDVGLWGVGDNAETRRPLKQFARVKVKVEGWKGKAFVEPPPNAGK